MSQLEMIEGRLSAVEQELAELKRSIAERSQETSWIEQIAGTFKDDPDFDEVVRLGREFRKS